MRVHILIIQDLRTGDEKVDCVCSDLSTAIEQQEKRKKELTSVNFDVIIETMDVLSSEDV